MSKFKKEKLLLLIPIHNYKEGVQRLEKFAQDELKNFFGDFQISLVNNNSNKDTINLLTELSKKENVSLYNVKKKICWKSV